RLWRIGDEELANGRVTGQDAEARARAAAEELRGAVARVAEGETAPRPGPPKPPVITSPPQQAALNRLGFGSQRTMKIAQQLYEGIALGGEGSVGLITYMRTDSPRLAGEAIGEMRRWLESTLGADYVPESPRQFKGKKGAQEAHEAIRPTTIQRPPASVRPLLTAAQWNLDRLTWKTAGASQAPP